MGDSKGEIFAMNLLRAYLKEEFGNEANIWRPEADPPDLAVRWPSGEIWGIEVRRVYIATQQIGKNAEDRSSAAVHDKLRRVGIEIETRTAATRHIGYTLFLSGPSAFDQWKLYYDDFRSWKKATVERVCEHISKRQSETLSIPGCRLRPAEDRSGLTIMTSCGGHEIESSSAAAIQRALNDKIKKLESDEWKLDCKERWLLLLNFYPLAEYDDAVEYYRQWRQTKVGPIFDRVLWNDYGDRRLKSLCH
ncbi:hypothetical protein [uncultured Jannaschia sp.]|uniref:hypothetical protein n=1 Tax=uncultured Jannaschia sp. TaxID=293347 RepID=UPI0026166FA2|nr:hypothetical protein [uncultured Jannaschia sp.]